MAEQKPIDKIGYIGLGIMGTPMATNLLNGGFKLWVWNRSPAKAKALEKLGATVVGSPAELAAHGLDAVCVNVTDTPDVEEVLFGAHGLAAKAKPGLVVIDHSTINPIATAQFAARLEKIGVDFLDAPVSGGDVGARNATLSIMVGGKEPVFKRCLPLFEKVGKGITYLGPAGMGQTCKACNQIAVSLNLLGVCEALALAKRSGLDLEKMIQIVSGGAAGSWQLANLGPKIAKGDMAPGFMINLVLKDLAIVGEAAQSLKLPLAGAALAEGYFRAAAAQAPEAGRQGTQAMSKALEKLANFHFAD